MKDTNMKKEVLDFIIYLIKCTKDGKQNYDDLEDWSINGSAKYLLAQVIRQLKIPDCNIFISRNAWERWKSLTDDNIMRKFYKDQVRAKIDCKLEQYIGKKKNHPITKVLTLKIVFLLMMFFTMNTSYP